VLEATEASFLEDSVTGSDGAGDREVVSGFGEHHSVYQLGEERFDREVGHRGKFRGEEFGL
jgi:hypothetical protein